MGATSRCVAASRWAATHLLLQLVPRLRRNSHDGLDGEEYRRKGRCRRNTAEAGGEDGGALPILPSSPPLFCVADLLGRHRLHPAATPSLTSALPGSSAASRSSLRHRRQQQPSASKRCRRCRWRRLKQ
ncbi:hypothetical protein EJB05_08876, partial [Eragrostis curvula]